MALNFDDPHEQKRDPNHYEILRGVVQKLLQDLREGVSDREKRRQVEEWMRSLADKFPEFSIELGLRDYYLSEADRLRGDFEAAGDLTDRLTLGRSIEGFLDKAADLDRRISDKS